MSYAPTNSKEVLNHLLSYLGQDQKNGNLSRGNQVIKQCLTEMLSAHPNINKIVESLKPYSDDALLIMIEALNLSGTEAFIMKTNAVRVLEKIGTHEAVSLTLENFNDYMNRFGFSYTRMLTTIAAREGEQTKRLIIASYINFLVYKDNVSAVRKQIIEDREIIAIMDSLIEMNIFDDPRLSDILEKYARKTDKKSNTHKLTLSALAKADERKAVELVNEKLKVTPVAVKRIPRDRIRSVYNPILNNANQGFLMLFIKKQEGRKSFLDIFVNKQKNPPLEETPYLFQYECPLIYFLEDGTQDHHSRSLAGRAERQNDVINVATQYLETKLTGNNLSETKLQECHKILAAYFNFENWGFHQSFIEPKRYPTFIYDSEWCRIKFAFDSSGDQHDHSTHLHVYYGRLHAPSDDLFMVWNGEKSWCWHSVELALHFLDGLSPEAATKVQYRPRIKEQYRESDLAKELFRISPAGWRAGMESEIWKQYGQRLFELFDLRRPELWERYSGFIREFYKIKKSESFGYPAYDKIC
jgi:hypothetical protein